MLLIAYKIINNKKVDVKTSTYYSSKDKFREDLKKLNIDFDGIDSIINF